MSLISLSKNCTAQVWRYSETDNQTKIILYGQTPTDAFIGDPRGPRGPMPYPGVPLDLGNGDDAPTDVICFDVPTTISEKLGLKQGDLITITGATGQKNGNYRIIRDPISNDPFFGFGDTRYRCYVRNVNA
jgi:hypothetical protein